MKKTALGLLALTLMAAPTFAQAPLNFADVDIDASGELSFEELLAVWPDLTQDEFMSVDLDMNGGLNADEVNALQVSTLTAPAPLDGGTMVPDAPAAQETPKSLVDSTQ